MWFCTFFATAPFGAWLRAPTTMVCAEASEGRQARARTVEDASQRGAVPRAEAHAAAVSVCGPPAGRRPSARAPHISRASSDSLLDSQSVHLGTGCKHPCTCFFNMYFSNKHTPAHSFIIGPAHSFKIGPAVINTHPCQCFILGTNSFNRSCSNKHTVQDV